MNSRFLRAAVNMITRLADIDINEQLRLENEYLRNENQVLTHQFKATGKRLVFTDAQRRELAIKAWKIKFHSLTRMSASFPAKSNVANVSAAS